MAFSGHRRANDRAAQKQVDIAMIRIVRAALALALALTSATAIAAEIAPIEGAQFRLGDTSFDTFYVPMADGYRVVTTAQTADARVIRFVTTLRSGEQATLSVPRGLGEAADEVAIVRTGAHVRIERAGTAMATN